MNWPYRPIQLESAKIDQKPRGMTWRDAAGRAGSSVLRTSTRPAASVLHKLKHKTLHKPFFFSNEPRIPLKLKLAYNRVQRKGKYKLSNTLLTFNPILQQNLSYHWWLHSFPLLSSSSCLSYLCTFMRCSVVGKPSINPCSKTKKFKNHF